MSLNNSNINGHLVPETISLKESEVILTYNTDNNFYSSKENLTVIPESAEEYLDYIVTEGKDIITYDKSSGLIKIKEGVTEGYGIITIKSKFPTKVKAQLKIIVTKSQTIKIFGNIYHIDKYGSLIIDGRELKEVGKVKSIEVYEYEYAITVYAITLDNRLYAWGWNLCGQVGNGSTEDQTTPYEVKEVGKVKSIEVYEYYSNQKVLTVYAITEDDRLYSWGDNFFGQVGNGKSGYNEYQTTPYEIKEVGKVKSIEVYEYYSNQKVLTIYAITEDDRLYSWGDNFFGQVGNGKSGYEEKQTTPYEIKEVGKVKSIKVYQYEYAIHEYATVYAITVYTITEDDRLYVWGYNIQNKPYEFKEVGKVKSIKVYEDEEVLTIFAITEDDRLYAWGDNDDGQVGNGKSGLYEKQTTPYEIKEVGKVKSVEVYNDTVYAITEDDRLYAWGDNYRGIVGNGSTEDQTTPYEIKEVGKVKSIEVDYKTVYAITEDNRLYSWGDNGYGQIGNGTTNYATTPYEIKGVGKVKSIKVYKYVDEYGCVRLTVYAITKDDRLYAWGDNEFGKVGNGKSGYREKQTTPYEVKEVGKVKSIEVGFGTVYAITEDDRLYAWGNNSRGQVGNGESDYYEEQTTPYEIKEVGKVKSIKVYKNEYKLTVYTITEDDRLYAWGKNIQDTPYEFKEIGKIKSFEEKEGNFYLTTIDDRLFTWGKDSKVGNGAIPYEIKEVE